ncbi:Trypsin-1 [Armadillidium vulgare]|nr:Trypsin-1 [Armadillidium vulgare]
MTGACLRDVVCNAESGRFMGYCGYDDGVCCDGICALRMELETFQLRKYSKDYCPFDSFTVLGTKKGKSSPICGNMTGGITPTNAGLINRDAKKYDPPPTPKPNITIFKLTTPTRSESSTESSTTEATTEEATTILTTLMEETITTTEVPEESSEENKTTKSFVPPKRDGGAAADEVTPLPVGSLPDIATPESVIARSLDGYYGNEEGDYEDKTPNSLFKETGDYCPLFQNSDNGGPNLRVPHPESIDRDNIDKCWFYDPVESIYKHNEECEWFEEAPDFAQFRIIGGKYANINDILAVALIYKQKFFCGGALISDRHVLTASHCVFGSFYGGIHNLSISLGDHDLKTKNETENLLLGVRRVNWNLHYSSDTTENDIAILELERPVEFSYSILPVNLPTDLTNSYSMQNATVTGWGRNSLRSKRTSSVLKKYTAPVDDIDTCVKSWTPYPAISAIKGMHLCLNVTYGTPCHGDSGGPLVSCNNGTRCTLIGVVSFGFPLCRNVGLPAVFTRVTTYKRWIDLNTTPHFYYNI